MNWLNQEWFLAGICSVVLVSSYGYSARTAPHPSKSDVVPPYAAAAGAPVMGGTLEKKLKNPEKKFSKRPRIETSKALNENDTRRAFPKASTRSVDQDDTRDVVEVPTSPSASVKSLEASWSISSPNAVAHGMQWRSSVLHLAAMM